MLQPVSVGHKALGDYRHLIGRALVEEIQALSEPMQGKRVLHLSATAMGGGVSEILYALVPLMRDAGLECDWQIILGREEFFNVTKLLHNALQGNPHGLSDEDWEIFHRYNKLNAGELDGEYDFVIVHDPQPAAMRGYLPDAAGSWIWRCHIDLSTPNPDAIERMVPMVEPYDCKVFHLQEYVPSGVDGKVEILPAGDRPAVAQEHGAVARGRRLRLRPVRRRRRPPADLPGVPVRPLEGPAGRDRRLPQREGGGRGRPARAGRLDGDRRPEGWDFFQQTHEHAAGDEDIKILNNLNNVGAIEVNAFQSQADVVLQKSIREGFGLTVSEALWKARPTIAGNVGGIPLQIQDGSTGYLVNSSEEAAEACISAPRTRSSASASAAPARSTSARIS